MGYHALAGVFFSFARANRESGARHRFEICRVWIVGKFAPRLAGGEKFKLIFDSMQIQLGPDPSNGRFWYV